MGASVSSNSIQNLIDTGTTVANSVAQNCSITGSAIHNQVSASGHCQIVGNITEDSSQYVNQTCVQNPTTQIAISSAVNQAISQVANSLVQQFAFGTVAASKNFLDNTVDMANAISNRYNQVCSIEASSTSNDVVCTGDATITGNITIKSYQSLIQNCMQKPSDITTIQNRLISNLQESAVAKQASTFAYILFAFVAILAIGAWFLISIADTPVVQWAIVGIVLFFVISSVIYTAIARSRGLYPYRKA